MTIKQQIIIVLIVGLWFFADSTARKNKKLVAQAVVHQEAVTEAKEAIRQVKSAFSDYVAINEAQAKQSAAALAKATARNKQYEDLLKNDPVAQDWANQPVPASVGGLFH